MANLGSDDTPVVADNVRTRVAEIDDTDSPYTTQGENQLEVDTSGGDVTVTIASADIPASGEPGRAVTIVNSAAGSVTIETEGAEQIQPDGVGSLTIETSGAFLDCRLLAGAVYVERNVSRNVIDAESVSVDETTTGQVGGPITSDPISSFTDGELFVNTNGALDAADVGPDITWLQRGSEPVSVQLAADESITVPTDEDWMVDIYAGDIATLLIDNSEVFGGQGEHRAERFVAEGGTEIKSEVEPTLLAGWDISDIGLETITSDGFSVSAGDVYVGALCSDDNRIFQINGVRADYGLADGSQVGSIWAVFEGGDSLDNGVFGGFVL